MTRISVRGKDPHAIVSNSDRLDFSTLGFPNGGPSPRGSTYYKSLLACPREHALIYEADIGVRLMTIALGRGLVWHFLLECYYRAVMAGRAREGQQLAFKAIEQIEYSENEQHRELGAKLRAMFDVYLSTYEDTDHWKILAVEETLEYYGAFDYTARLDLLIEDLDRGGLWIVEHKTARALTNELLDNYQMDLQILGQVWLVLHCVDLSKYPKFMGAIPNVITTSHTVPRVARTDVLPSLGHLAMFEEAMLGWTSIRRSHQKLGWPRALGHCSGYARGYSKCEFFELCHDNPRTGVEQWKNADDDQIPEIYQRRPKELTNGT